MSTEKPELNTKLYNELFYRTPWNNLTEEEKEFCKDMYIMEEYAVGLDG